MELTYKLEGICCAIPFSHTLINNMLLKNLLLGAALVTSAAAHPWMARDGEAPTPEKKGCPFGFDKMAKLEGESHEELVKRQLLGLGTEDGLLGLGLEETLQNALGGVGGLLEGLLGSLAELGNGETRVPDENHPFQAPGPTDQRGPCPGLNTLANHGCKSIFCATFFGGTNMVADEQTSHEAVSSLLARSSKPLQRASTWVPIYPLS